MQGCHGCLLHSGKGPPGRIVKTNPCVSQSRTLIRHSGSFKVCTRKRFFGLKQQTTHKSFFLGLDEAGGRGVFGGWNSPNFARGGRRQSAPNRGVPLCKRADETNPRRRKESSPVPATPKRSKIISGDGNVTRKSFEGEVRSAILLQESLKARVSGTQRALFPCSSWFWKALSLCNSVTASVLKPRSNVAALHYKIFNSIGSFSATTLQKVTSRLWTRAGRQSQRIFCSLVTTASPLFGYIENMAIFNWLENLGRTYGASLVFLVGLGYWIQGFRCFPWLGVNFYFKDVLNVDPGTLQIVQNTVNLPMVAKPIYGIVSDAVYIRGAHRVPYLVIGGLLQVLSWGVIAFLPGGGSSVLVIAIFLALSNLGASMVDVANDALVAECAKRKKSTGELQSFAWLSTAAGGVLGNLLVALALSRVEFKTIFGVFLVLVLFQVVKCVGANEGSFGLRMPHGINGEVDKRNGNMDFSKLSKKRVKLSNMMNGSDNFSTSLAIEGTEDGWRHSGITLMRNETTLDEEGAKIAGMCQQFTDLIHLVKQPEILYPLAWFMASYAMIPTLAGTMFFYQTQYLKINPLVIGLAKVMGQVGLMGGSVVYNRFLKGMPLRKLLGAIQMLLSFCILSDILLVRRINVQLGIPDEVLVLGASAFVDAINQFKILPFMVLLAQLCPAGSEGSLLAAFMSIQCLATIVSGYLGVTLASFLHISSNNFSELPMGIFIQAMAALLPLIWISFIPEGSKMSTLQPRDGKST